MFAKSVIFIAILVVVHGGYIGGGLEHGGISSFGGSGIALASKGIVDYDAPPQYEYKYAVSDPHTGDWKEQEESRAGDLPKVITE
ncbi:hypothetical protein JTB14_027547 [Gonioctena quinquepunctata]|nr:hypothetical protein JTB14_027547 [Gonioctena quinquepunctata]